MLKYHFSKFHKINLIKTFLKTLNLNFVNFDNFLKRYRQMENQPK